MAVVQNVQNQQPRSRQTAPPPRRQSLPQVNRNRSFALYLLLSIVTFSGYHYWFLSGWVQDLNIVCKKDGEKTLGVGWMILLSLATLGVYKYVWLAGIIDRMYNNADDLGAEIRQDGESFFLWVMLVPVVGYFIAMYFAIRDMNRLTAAWAEQAAAPRKRPEQPARPAAAEHRPEASALPKEQHSTPIAERGTLLGVSGTYAGAKVELRPGEKILLGRDASRVSVVLDDPHVGRVHCAVQFDGEKLGYCVTNFSANGVTLSGRQLPLNQPAHAKRGDLIALADGKNRFQLL